VGGWATALMTALARPSCPADPQPTTPSLLYLSHPLIQRAPPPASTKPTQFRLALYCGLPNQKNMSSTTLALGLVVRNVVSGWVGGCAGWWVRSAQTPLAQPRPRSSDGPHPLISPALSQPNCNNAQGVDDEEARDVIFDAVGRVVVSLIGRMVLGRWLESGNC